MVVLDLGQGGFPPEQVAPLSTVLWIISLRQKIQVSTVNVAKFPLQMNLVQMNQVSEPEGEPASTLGVLGPWLRPAGGSPAFKKVKPRGGWGYCLC